GAVFDGVVMLSQSIGGRNNGFGNYDQGRTLAHEVGHYLGLLHTFEGGKRCSNNFSSGDLIADTNAESEPFFGSSTSCPARSTCGTPDPVDNFMGYNTDRCMARFTSQQANRMLCSLINYRPGLFQLEINGALIPVIDLLMENQSS
ncbi:MAG: hypothetical protein KTR16_00275, partial [Acidiferrobacterales bacterium]|nr:hypothetical protein [Acidiferrobacterales bacterium]